MIKEIKYNGFTETPSDYECPDGDLATVTGLVPEDEALHPVQPPCSLFKLPKDYTVCFVHANASGYKHYIIRDDHVTGTTKFYWLNMPASFTTFTQQQFTNATRTSTDVAFIVEFTGKTIYEVSAIGNTLLFLTDDGMFYSLWKGDNDGYKNLGYHFPELPISFGLKGSMERGEVFEFGFNEIPNTHSGGVVDYQDVGWYRDFTEENKEVFTRNVLAKVNKFIADKTKEGKFIFPFLVRYAYRLYDQTLTMHSAPVLMACSSDCVPQCLLEVPYLNGDDYDFNEGLFRIASMAFQLDCQVMDSHKLVELKDWSDIVESVDIFVSAPIYTYDQSGECKRFKPFPDYNEHSGYKGFSVCKLTNAQDPTQTTLGDYYQKVHYQSLYNAAVGYYGSYVTGRDRYISGSVPQSEAVIPDRLHYIVMSVELPTHDATKVEKDIEETSNFYFLKSYDLDDLAANARTVIDFPSGYLNSLTSRETMSDEYGSHDQLIAKYAFTYNSRLNISGLSKVLFKGFNTFSQFCFTDIQNIKAYKVRVLIREDNKEMVVEDNTLACYLDGPTLRYLYYPNTNAYKAYIYYSTGLGYEGYEVKLTPHAGLNGAVWFGGFEAGNPTALTLPPITTDNKVEMPNKLYTSEVNNPFLFLPKGMRTIGFSKIVGIRPAVKAMSPSQYGQFKFYCFTNDGVWALEVTSEGYLQEPSLVAPDVVLGNDANGYRSITQIDGSVLFASDRGIMMLNGSTCTCISDILNSHAPFVPFGTTAADDVLPGLRSVCGDFVDTVKSIVPFRVFIKDCSMLYDYNHQRIIVYSPSYPYAYAFSLKSKLWGMIPSAIVSTLLDYPNGTAMVLTDDEYPMLVDYSQEPAGSGTPPVVPPVDALIITRPLKLDMPDVLKTIDCIIQRGNFRKGHVQSILYASCDLYNWFLVKSSVDQYLRGFRGTPYKYFRVVLLCQLSDNESVFGCSISFTPRYQNQLR